jgi:hypothetical protein
MAEAFFSLFKKSFKSPKTLSLILLSVLYLGIVGTFVTQVKYFFILLLNPKVGFEELPPSFMLFCVT